MSYNLINSIWDTRTQAEQKAKYFQWSYGKRQECCVNVIKELEDGNSS